MAGKDFPSTLALASVKQPRAGARVQHLEVEWKGTWWPARILESSGGKTKVHYAGFGPEWDEWVGPQRLRPYRPTTFARGTNVKVEWRGQWWPAKVKESRSGIHLIEYTGFGREWDEWVGPKRIRP